MEDGDDLQSVNLLMRDGEDTEDRHDDETVDPTAQPTRRVIDVSAASVLGQSPGDPDQSHNDEDNYCSPATQTLNALSQSQQGVDLHYDFSQLEYDVVETLLQTKKACIDADARDKLEKYEESSDDCDIENDSPQVKKKRPNENNEKVGRGSRNVERPLDPAQTLGRIPKIERRCIQQIDLRTGRVAQTYKSITEAGQGVGFSRHIVASILKGNYKSENYKGWTFRYVYTDTQSQGGDDDEESQLVTEAAVTTKRTYNRIQQINVATDKCVATFQSIRLAAEQTRITRRKISAMVKGELHSCDGWTFRYEDDERKLKNGKDFVPSNKSMGQYQQCGKLPHFADKTTNKSRRSLTTRRKRINRVNRGGNAIAVEEVDLTTGKVLQTYQSMTEAATESQVRRRIISDVLKGKMESWMGKKWRYFREDESGQDLSVSMPLGMHLQIADHSTVVDDDVVQNEGIRKRQRGAQEEDSNLTTLTNSAVISACSKIEKNQGTTKDARTLDSVKNEPAEKKARRVSDGPSSPCSHRDRVRTNIDSSKLNDENGKTKKTVITPHRPAVIKETEKHRPDTSASSQVEAGVDSELREYEVRAITIAKEGSLGVKITKMRAPDSLLSFVRKNHGLHKANEGERQVNVLHFLFSDEPSIAGDVGIEAGDWLLYPTKVDLCNTKGASNCILYSDYNVVVDAIKHGTRPLLLFVAREKRIMEQRGEQLSLEVESNNHLMSTGNEGMNQKSAIENGENSAMAAKWKNLTPLKIMERKQVTTIVAQSKNQASPFSERAKLYAAPDKMTKLKTQNTKSREDGVSLEGRVVYPFCALCSGRQTSRPLHHAWCPNNVQFVNSGAVEIFERLRRGIRLGCSVCLEEYETGRPLRTAKHSKACRRATRVTLLEKDGSRDDSSVGVRTKSSKRKRDDPVITYGKLEGCDEPQDSQSICLSHTSDHDDDSVYACPSKSRGPRQRLLVVKNKNVSANTLKASKCEDNKERSKDSGTGRQSNQAVKNMSQSRTNNRFPNVDTKSKPKASISEIRRAGEATAAKSKNESSRTEVDDLVSYRAKTSVALVAAGEEDQEADPNDKLTITWEQCENVWGPSGHMDNDVVIFSALRGLGHHETVFSSERYELDPFSSVERYNNTHSSPEVGLQAIVLRRDALASRPWGFSCQRHEFGGACLVSCVDPLSPAKAATFLGAGSRDPCKASLRVNDMVLAVNGKTVGGMTTTGVEIELDESGPNLILLVSRYKFPDLIRETIVQAEQSYLHAVDASINDDRLLSWTDISSWKSPAIVHRDRKDSNDIAFPDVTVSATCDVNYRSHDPYHVQLSGSPSRDELVNGQDLPNDFGTEKTEWQLEWELGAEGCDSDKRSLTFGASDKRSLGEEAAGGEEKSSSSKRMVAYHQRDSSPLFTNQRDPRRGEVMSADIGDENLASFRLSSKREVVVEKTDKYNPIRHTEGNELHHSGGDVSDAVESRMLSDEPKPLLADLEVKSKDGCIELHIYTPSDSDIDLLEGQDCSESEQDDGNAWYGCVCGIVHKKNGKHKEIFWIQCENCLSWYDSSSYCLGFAHHEAESIDWTCWGCPKESVTVRSALLKSQSTDENTSYASLHRLSLSPITKAEQGRRTSLTAQTKKARKIDDRLDNDLQSSNETQISMESTAKSKGEGFEADDFVFVEEHGWPGVSNHEGVAKVLKAYIDDDGEQVYDIRYIVEKWTRKGVLRDYLRRHKFD